MKTLKYFARDFAALAAELAALVALGVLLVSAGAVMVAETIEATLDAIALGASALIWMAVCGIIAYLLRDSETLDENINQFIGGKK